MPDVWTPDDLQFAVVRAMFLESPRAVADELLAAAAQPATRLSMVSPFQARVRAAEVLRQAGEQAGSVAIMQQALLDPGRDPDGKARMTAAAVLAELGDGDQAANLALQVMRDLPGDPAAPHGRYVALSLLLAANGCYTQGLDVADACAADVAGSGRRMGALGSRLTTLASMTKQEILAMQERNAGEDADPGARTAASQRRKQEATAQALAGALSKPPWPALDSGFMLWFPEDQYARLIRQLPELAGVLGASWREHTSRVEAALAEQAMSLAPDGGQRPMLAAGDSWTYADFAEHATADPRLASVLTAYTERAAKGLGTPAPWPPGRRDRCWCGSGQRYQRCCGTGRG
jgi:hypothetical protein